MTADLGDSVGDRPRFSTVRPLATGPARNPSALRLRSSRVETLAGKRGVFGVQLTEDRLPAFLHGDQGGGSGTAERVQHYPAAGRTGQHARPYQVRREGCEVGASVTSGGYRPDAALVPCLVVVDIGPAGAVLLPTAFMGPLFLPGIRSLPAWASIS